MSYQHLSTSERGKIAQLWNNGISIHVIAHRLNRSPSTISREIARNRSGEKYLSRYAQSLYLERRMRCRRRPLYERPEVVDFVSEKLMLAWSPEQISGRLGSGRDGLGFTVSFASIYRWLSLGLLPRSVQLQMKLRHYGRRHGEKRGVKVDARELKTRCKEALQRKRYGDWEADTIVFGVGAARRYILNISDRKSRYSCLLLLRNTSKKEMLRAFMVFFEDGRLPLETMTSDRGSEFSCHKEFEALLKANYYYTRPASPWQKPTVENTNGLVRQFLPRSISAEELDPDTVAHVMDLLNNRPRKCLNWATPNELLHFT